MADAEGKYINADDVVLRHTQDTFMQIYDDDSVGDLKIAKASPALQQDIDSAEGEVDSWLITENKLPLPTTTNPSVDRLVKACALDFCQALGFRRHPEYVRTFGENGRADSLWKMATDRMRRIQEATQQLPDVVQQTGKKQANVGGIVFDSGPRTVIDGADGTHNSGDL